MCPASTTTDLPFLARTGRASDDVMGSKGGASWAFARRPKRPLAPSLDLDPNTPPPLLAPMSSPLARQLASALRAPALGRAASSGKILHFENTVVTVRRPPPLSPAPLLELTSPARSRSTGHALQRLRCQTPSGVHVALLRRPGHWLCRPLPRAWFAPPYRTSRISPALGPTDRRRPLPFALPGNAVPAHQAEEAPVSPLRRPRPGERATDAWRLASALLQVLVRPSVRAPALAPVSSPRLSG